MGCPFFKVCLPTSCFSKCTPRGPKCSLPLRRRSCTYGAVDYWLVAAKDDLPLAPIFKVKSSDQRRLPFRVCPPADQRLPPANQSVPPADQNHLPLPPIFQVYLPRTIVVPPAGQSVPVPADQSAHLPITSHFSKCTSRGPDRDRSRACRGHRRYLRITSHFSKCASATKVCIPFFKRTTGGPMVIRGPKCTSMPPHFSSVRARGPKCPPIFKPPTANDTKQWTKCTSHQLPF